MITPPPRWAVGNADVLVAAVRSRSKAVDGPLPSLTSRCSRRGPRKRTDNESLRGAARAAERRR